MIDLHSHILPGIDDGAKDLSVSLEMARAYVEQGIGCVACTPHILPGLYNNFGPQIRSATAALQKRIDAAGLSLRLQTGADNHIAPDLVASLRSGQRLALGDTRYVLVEPPHRLVPARLEHLFFELLVAGFVPILTHPERLLWIEAKYEVIGRLVDNGVWIQLTAGSLIGSFGQRARYWAERMLCEGLVHLLATDAHDMLRRPPNLLKGRRAAEKLIGAEEVELLVATRPEVVLRNGVSKDAFHSEDRHFKTADGDISTYVKDHIDRRRDSFARRLRRFYTGRC